MRASRCAAFTAPAARPTAARATRASRAADAGTRPHTLSGRNEATHRRLNAHADGLTPPPPPTVSVSPAPLLHLSLCLAPPPITVSPTVSVSPAPLLHLSLCLHCVSHRLLRPDAAVSSASTAWRTSPRASVCPAGWAARATAPCAGRRASTAAAWSPTGARGWGDKWIAKQRESRAPSPDQTVSRGVKMSS